VLIPFVWVLFLCSFFQGENEYDFKETFEAID